MVRNPHQALATAGRAVLHLLLALAAGGLAAQVPTGTIEGHVRDATGSPIVEAQLYIVGTAYHAQTDPRGHYFINNVPAGVIALRTQFIGFRPVEVQDLRVFADHTVTQDFALEAEPIELEEISVVAAYNVLVPRDQVTTRQRIEGKYVDRLPVDRLAQIIALEPGVVANSGGGALSIRGGRPEETGVYIDGVPVRRTDLLVTPNVAVPATGGELTVSTNALEEASVTTGGSSAEFGGFQSGVISIQTRAGGTRYSGSLSYESDEPFGVKHGIGFNRIEASFGGPLAKHLTFFVSGTLDGARSPDSGKDAWKAPLFVSAGVDTTVGVPAEPENPLSDTTYVDILKLAAYRGDCGQFRHSANPGIRSNYGLPCQGIREPYHGSSSYRVQGKLSFTYGSGSRVALSVYRTQTQSRSLAYGDFYNPQNLDGNRNWGNIFTLNWTHNLSRTAGRALALDSYLSYQQDREIDGVLDPSEISGGDPIGGFRIRPLKFRWDLDNLPITRRLLNDFLLEHPRVAPLGIDTSGQYAVIDQYRNDAYGLPGWAESGGPSDWTYLNRENRLIGRSNVDWQLDRNNRLKAGAEFTRYSIASYLHALTSYAGDVYIEQPIRWGAYAEHRLDLGDLVLVGGLRYDWYDSRASRPDFPRVSSMPGFDSTNPRALFHRDRSHHYLSPHLQVAFPVTTRTNFRLSYAQQVQNPDWGFILSGINGDAGNREGWGADLDFGRTIIFEFGIRHAFNEDMVLDLAAYNKDNLSNTAARSFSVEDPLTHHPIQLISFTNADFGNTRGVDVRLDRRFGSLFNGMIGYTFQHAKSTGSDPFSNLRRGVVNVTQLGGSIEGPPQSIATTGQSRPHTLAGQLSLNFPHRWHSGSGIGAVFQDLGVFAVFRLTSGRAYTPCLPGLGNATPGGQCITPGPVNSARLPMFKQFDLRVTKGFRLGAVDFTGYLDARNLFNFTNVLRVFTTTRDVTDPNVHQAAWAGDSVDYALEGQASGVWRTDGSLDLGFGGAVASGCAAWVTAGGRPAAPNCVYLIRAEERFGNGDHIFTVREQRRASDARYGVDHGLHNLTGTPRRLRVGIEVSF